MKLVMKNLSLLIICFSVLACGGGKESKNTIDLWLAPFAYER